MVLMDMPDVTVLFECAAQLLAPNGAFVFAIQHPCFNSAFTQEYQDGIHITDYQTVYTSKGVAIPMQKHEQYYFHRPIAHYLQLAFKNGFTVSGWEEPVFSTETHSGVFTKIPPVLVVRLQHLNA
jgi:hypothetical protein